MFGPIFSLIYDEARKVWCFRGLMAGVSAVIFAAAAVVIFSLPNVYRSSGQLLVTSKTPLTISAGNVSLVGDSYGNASVIQKTLLNEPAVRRVYLRAYPKATPQEVDAGVSGIRGRAKITPQGDEGFVEFAYSDSDPIRTQKITKALMEQFVAENLSRNVQDLQQASNFLDQQIASYAAQIAANEGQMSAFRRQHPRIALSSAPLAAPTPSGDGAAEVAGARAELAAALGRSPSAAPIVAPQDGAIAEAEGRLAGLLTQYTEQHPDVIAARRQIAALKAQRAQFMATAPAPTAPADPAVAAARARLAAAQARARASAGPALSEGAADLAAQWAELSRKHDTLAENYQQMIQRREGAKMSQAIYGSADSGQFQITGQPTVPGAPSGPDRKMYLAAVAVLALGAGLAAAYLRASIAGIFVSPRALEDAFQLPVIGTVSWEPAWHVSKSKRSTPALPAR